MLSILLSRVCTTCNKDKSIDNYYFVKSNKRPDRYERICKECRNAYKNAWAQKNKEKRQQAIRRYAEAHPEYVKEWKKKHPDRVRLINKLRESSKRAKTIEKIDFTLIERWERVCGICKEVIEGKYHLDHIQPLSKGGVHSMDNLQLAHPLCNMRKGAKW